MFNSNKEFTITIYTNNAKYKIFEVRGNKSVYCYMFLNRGGKYYDFTINIFYYVKGNENLRIAMIYKIILVSITTPSETGYQKGCKYI